MISGPFSRFASEQLKQARLAKGLRMNEFMAERHEIDLDGALRLQVRVDKQDGALGVRITVPEDAVELFEFPALQAA